MRRLAISIIAMCFPAAVWADSVLATHNIRANTILGPGDVTVRQDGLPSAVSQLRHVIGMEAKVVLYEGRPIKFSDIGPAAIIERNQIVTLVFRQRGLSISTEARSLGRAGPGEILKVMNLASRTTISGMVADDGSVVVGATQQNNS